MRINITKILQGQYGSILHLDHHVNSGCKNANAVIIDGESWPFSVISTDDPSMICRIIAVAKKDPIKDLTVIPVSNNILDSAELKGH